MRGVSVIVGGDSRTKLTAPYIIRAEDQEIREILDRYNALLEFDDAAA